MPRATANTFRQKDVNKALKGMKDAGIDVAHFRVEIDGGKIVILAGSEPGEPATDFDRWKAGQRAQ